MRWGFVRKFPKFVLVAGVIIGSTALFAFWWMTRSVKRPQPIASAPAYVAPVENHSAAIARIESAWDHLLLVDNDLYDVDTGADIFKDWLKGDMPLEIFYDQESKKILARYPNGFIRYDLEGNEEATLLRNSKPSFSYGYKWATYVQDRDIWRADIDWKEFKFVNERRVTNIEQFNESSFADSIVLGTGKTLVVRNTNQLLRVDLDTGDVKPLKLPFPQIAERRSPDSKWVLGLQGGQFYCYDVDKDQATTIPVGRGAINDYQWIGNNACAMIASARGVILYNRLKNTLTEIAALPSISFNIGDPSPDGHYVFCASRGSALLVDLQKKTVARVAGGAGLTWISDAAFAFSRDVQDSELRGTWFQTAGERERRVSPEPYLKGRAIGEVMVMKPASIVIFLTAHGIAKINADGNDLSELINLIHPSQRLLGIYKWEND